MKDRKLKEQFEELQPDPLIKPYELWLMITDVEHELYAALSTSDREGIVYWAKLLRDMMNFTIERAEIVKNR